MNMYDDTVSSQAILIPAEVFVGDRVQYQYRFTSDAVPVQEDHVVDSALFSDFYEATIESIIVRVHGVNVLVMIDFIPWKAGALTLPSIEVGTMHIVLPPVRIASILDRTGIQEMRGARPPLLLPGTVGMLYGTAAVSVTVIVLTIILVRILVSVIRRSSLLNPALRICRLLQKQLKRLERDVIRVPAHVWLARYQSLVRRLLTVLFDSEQASKTVPEMRTSIADSEKTQEIAAGCISLLDKTDVLRFAGKVPSDIGSGTGQGTTQGTGQDTTQDTAQGSPCFMQHTDAGRLCEVLYGYVQESYTWFRTERGNH